MLGASGLFSPLSEQVFPNPVRIDPDMLRARIASLTTSPDVTAPALIAFGV